MGDVFFVDIEDLFFLFYIEIEGSGHAIGEILSYFAVGEIAVMGMGCGGVICVVDAVG